MAKKKRNREFWESGKTNAVEFRKYYNRLAELAMSMFEWHNLPDTVDARFLELTLLTYGHCLFFKDEEIGFLALPCMLGGELDVYRIPKVRTAYASNGYHNVLNADNSVIIFNNMLHTNSLPELEDFAMQLYDIERTIIVNAKAQKTPVLITCTESQRLTLKNTYMQYDGNMPVIYANTDFDPQALKAISTGATYCGDKLYQLKTALWNEALTFLGISNLNVQKKERLISDEVTRSMGGVIASRYSRLNTRKQAAALINKMFGDELEDEVTVDFRDDFREMDDEFMIEENYDGTTATKMVEDLRTRSGFKLEDGEEAKKVVQGDE